MKVPVIGALMGLALCLAGCGGSELKPNEQREYDKLKAEQASISKKIGAANARADRAFNSLGSAEAKKRMVVKGVALCGGRSVSGQSFGPFPWGSKKKARLTAAGRHTMGGQSCAKYSLKVVK